MNKKDIFYYAKLNGVPVYFQPEENEVIGRNWFCNLMLVFKNSLDILRSELKLSIEL